MRILFFLTLIGISTLIIPFSVFAQEPQTGETIEEDSQVKYVVGAGLVFVIILAIIAGRYRKKFFAESLPIKEWTEVKKEQRSEEHTSELQSQAYLVCRLLLEKKKINKKKKTHT